ncbi:MAG TPA: dTMP kinase [Azospirillaceae bacterium]|nr:dTMP kinase [Azospirillaceae bacterium]
MATARRRGRFITLEGGEGAGKSTQARRLAEALAARGVDCLLTREPGGSPGAEEIRALLVNGEPGRWSPTTEALLLTAARRDHLERTVQPALAAGRWVVCDRFSDSTLAYQGYGAGLPLDDLRTLFRLALGDFMPDLTLVFDLPVDVGLGRATARAGGEDRFERMGRDFHQRLRDGFRAIAAAEPERCAVIDAGADIDAVTADVLAVVSARLPESAS